MQVLNDIYKTLWASVVEVKNTKDSIAFKSFIRKKLSPILHVYYQNQLKDLSSSVLPSLSLIDDAKRKIKEAKDKRLASEEFIVYRAKLIESNPQLQYTLT
jgi:hypothetical protein